MSKINKVQNNEKEDNNHIDSLNLDNDQITTKTNPSNRIPYTKIRQKAKMKKPKILYTSKLWFQNKYDFGPWNKTKHEQYIQNEKENYKR